MFTSLKRIVRSGFVGFWRNGFVSLAAIFVLTITLTVIASSMLLNELLRVTLVQLAERVDVNVYMVPTANEEAVLALRDTIQGLPGVVAVTYTSREDALASFRERRKNDELTLQALEELGDNPLGASLAIRATDPSQYESINSFLQSSREQEVSDAPVIDRVNFNDNKDAIDKLTRIIDSVEQSSFIALIVLVVSSILIAFNTIRLAIYTTREEIGVMRLVGASNMFIRGPFVLQGIMYGLIAGVLALLIVYPAVLWLGPNTADFFGLNIANYFMDNFGQFFLILVGSGVIIAMFSSLLAIARYLRI